jgi:hypothetical protein
LRRQAEHRGETKVVYRLQISNFQKTDHLRPPQVME